MNGVDDMLYMQSTNANDGTMTLTVSFDVDTVPNIDQVNVQNRMAQAQPNLPPEVSQFGLTMRKQTGLPMLIVSLSSPKQDATTRCSWPTTPTSTSSTRSTACPASARRASSAPATTRCASGSSRTPLARLGLTVPDVRERDPAAEHGQSRRARSAPTRPRPART